MSFIDPGDQPKGRRRARRPDLKAPEPASLFDISDNPPPTPMRVNSDTSIGAAKESAAVTITRRRSAVFQAIKGAAHGLARFQVAGVLRIPDHWVSSSIDALIKQRKIEESDRTVINPTSGKSCAVLVAIESGEVEESPKTVDCPECRFYASDEESAA